MSPGIKAGDDYKIINCAVSLTKPLAMLYNISFVTGCILNEWKLASVFPIYKKHKGQGCVENYRPISPSFLAVKLFEDALKGIEEII